MFVRVTTSGPRKYVKLLESYRDDQGKPKQKVIATLGRLEQIEAGSANSLLNGLLRVTGKPPLEAGTGDIDFTPARSIGDTWLLTSLWKELGFSDAFRKVLRSKRSFDAERLLRVMVFNRLCDPESKLGILRWLEGAIVPEVPQESVNHQHLLRTMDTLSECTDTLEETMAELLRPLIDQELSIVFYDLTTIRTEGSSETDDEIRKYGLSKEGGIHRQVMLGVVQTADGLPIHHEVFEGNAAETRTLIPTIKKIIRRYPIKRVVLVADRGLLSLDNLESIREIHVGDHPLEFILAVPARRYGDFDQILKSFHNTRCTEATEEVTGELEWSGFRLIVAHRPDIAREQSKRRIEKIAALEADAASWTGKLDHQDEGKVYRGRKLSDAGVTARFYKAVSDAHLSNIIKIDLSSELFNYNIDEKALRRAEMIDGKLILVTNMPDHTPGEIVSRYKALSDIERGFRVLKSEIEIAPVFHRKPERIRAHALICFLALVLYRVLRMRLKANNKQYTPERVLEIVRRIQYHQVTLHRKQSASGLSTMTPEQKELFESVELPRPDKKRL